jgi:hypothetical protein
VVRRQCRVYSPLLAGEMFLPLVRPRVPPRRIHKGESRSLPLADDRPAAKRENAQTTKQYSLPNIFALSSLSWLHLHDYAKTD